MKRSYFQRLRKAINHELKENRASFLVYSLLRITVICIALHQFLNKNYENVFFCVLTLALLIVPCLIQVQFKIDIPQTLEIILYLFIFSAEVLGEIGKYYLTFPYWDTILHTINGFLSAAIGFSMVNLLNENEKLQFELSPLFLVLVSFCFSMTIGALWEILEYSLDQFLGVDSQKDMFIHTIRSVSLNAEGKMKVVENIQEVTVNGELLSNTGYLDIGLIDTMQDLIVNLIGACIFSVFGFKYFKDKKNKELISHFSPIKKVKTINDV